MAKKEFWDEGSKKKKTSERKKKKEKKQFIEDTQMVVIDDKFHPTTSGALKTIVHVIMFLAAMVMAVSLFVFYKYNEDRNVNGYYASTYFDSLGFSELTNEKVESLIDLAKNIEKNDSILDEENSAALQSLAESYMGGAGNVAYVIYNVSGDVPVQVVKSDDDAVSRIEESNHYVKVNMKDGNFTVTNSVPEKGLQKAEWKELVADCENNYSMYLAVDNNITYKDAYYDSFESYNKLGDYNSLAKIAGIIAVVLFVLCLIFAIAATGKKKNSTIIKLTWFDKIATELAFIISIVALGGIAFGAYMYWHKELPLKLYVLIGAVVIFYVLAIRIFMSLIRRIKSGEFVENSFLYMIGSKINKGLNKLPAVVKYIIIIIFLVALNGGLILAQTKMTDVKVMGIPVMFIVSIFVFLIEFIVFICCIFSKKGSAPAEKNPANEISEEEMDNFYELDKKVSEKEYDDYSEEPEQDYSDLDYALTAGETKTNIYEKASDRTQIISDAEVEAINNEVEAVEDIPAVDIEESLKAANDAGEMAVKEAIDGVEAPAVPEAAIIAADLDAVEEIAPEAAEGDNVDLLPVLDLVDITKVVRKSFVKDIKAKGLTIALRTPGKAVEARMTASDANDFVSVIIANVIKYAKEGSKAYVEIYNQNEFVIYVAKVELDEQKAADAVKDMDFDVEQAKYIVEKYSGKLASEIGADQCRIGVLLKG